MKKKFISLFIITLIVTTLSGCYGMDKIFLSNDYFDKLANITYPSFTFPTSNSSTSPSNSITSSIKPNTSITLPVEYEKYYDLKDYSYVYKTVYNDENLNEDEILSLYELLYTFEANNPQKTPNDKTGIYEGYNLINIQGESFDTRFVSEKLTPNIYNLMQQSIIYENFYAVEFYEGATCNSEFSAITGLFPINAPVYSSCMCSNFDANVYPFSLPSQLSDNGYTTYYFHPYFELFYNRLNLVPNYGFDVAKFWDQYRNDNNLKDANAANFYRHDTNINKLIENYADFDSNNPFFFNILTYSQHGSYNESSFDLENKDIIDEILIEMYGEEKASMIDIEVVRYLQRQYEFDSFVGGLIELLKEKGVYNNTIINIYRDHHPYMMSKEIYLDYLENYLELDEKEYTGINILKHQFITHIPGMTEQVIDYTPYSLVDIAPTWLNLLGVKANYTYFAGSDIYDGDHLVLLEPTAHTGKTKYSVTDGIDYLSVDPLDEDNTISSGAKYAYFRLKYNQFYQMLEVTPNIYKYNLFQYFKETEEQNE